MSAISSIPSSALGGGSGRVSLMVEEAKAVERARARAADPQPEFLSPFSRLEKLFGEGVVSGLADLFQPLRLAGETAERRSRFLDMLGRVRDAEDRFGPAELLAAAPPLKTDAGAGSDAEGARAASRSSYAPIIDVRV